MRRARLVFARHLRQLHAGEVRQLLDSFRERQSFGLHHEVEDAAVLAGGEIEPGLLVVVDEERRRLLLVERRQALHLPARAGELDAPAHDFRDRKTGFQLIEELGREAHGRWFGLQRARKRFVGSGRIGPPIIGRRKQVFRGGAAGLPAGARIRTFSMFSTEGTSRVALDHFDIRSYIRYRLWLIEWVIARERSVFGIRVGRQQASRECRKTRHRLRRCDLGFRRPEPAHLSIDN